MRWSWRALCHRPRGFFGILDDYQKIRSSVLNCGQNWVIVVRARTSHWRDVTVNASMELLILKPHQWGEVWNAIAASEGHWCGWIRGGGRVLGDLQSHKSGNVTSQGRRISPLPRLRRSGRRLDHLVGMILGRWPDSILVGPRWAFLGFFWRFLWAFGLYHPTVSFVRGFGGPCYCNSPREY